MDINNKNIKIYTFKLDFDDLHGYCIANNQSLYEIYKKYPSHKFMCCHDDINNINIISLYDTNNNVPKLLNFICKKIDKTNISYNDNQGKRCIFIPSYEENNIYFKDMYINFSKYINEYKQSYYNCIDDSIKNHKIISILINNFCKLHYIGNINITLQKHKNNHNFVLETITFIIDETKEPNNRKIKFYVHFSDFYRTKNKDINYKIIQEPIGDGYCLIEEIEEIEKVIEPIQNIEQKQEVIKTSEDIIREKDAEIEKLKKEILELKKFYINS